MKRLITLLGVVYLFTLCFPSAFAWDRDYLNPLNAQTQEGTDEPSGEDHPWGENDQVGIGDSGQMPSGLNTWYNTSILYLKHFWLGWDHPKVVKEIKQTNQEADDINQVSDPEETRENESNNSTKPGNS